MSAIRVFPGRTTMTPDDPLAFVGFPPFPEFRPADPETPVFVSVVFKWLRERAERIAESWRMYYRDVRLGGPAYGDLGQEFTPGMFLKRGCTITSRGCVMHCGWCPERFNPLREIEIKPGWIVQDSNLLACSERHVRKVFDMLREQNRAITFSGGLDKRFLRDWHRPLFDSIKLHELWFACDQTNELPLLERAAKILDGIPMKKLRCYTMIGWDPAEDLRTAEWRQERVFELGFIPFCQLYQPDEGVKIYPEEWRNVSRRWKRPAAMPWSDKTGVPKSL